MFFFLIFFLFLIFLLFENFLSGIILTEEAARWNGIRFREEEDFLGSYYLRWGRTDISADMCSMVVSRTCVMSC